MLLFSPNGKNVSNRMQENQTKIKRARKRKRRVRKKKSLTARTLQKILRSNIAIYLVIGVLAVLIGFYILIKQWEHSSSDKTTSSPTTSQ